MKPSFLMKHFPFFEERVLSWNTKKSSFKSGFRTKVYESHCEEIFWDTTCFRKHFWELSLKHLYMSVSLLNDISRNVQNIDYTRDMSLEEYFLIYWFYIVFVFFGNFIFLYFVFAGFSNFVFCFSKIFTAKRFWKHFSRRFMKTF